MTVFSIRKFIGAVLITGLSISLPSIAHSYDLGDVKLHGFLSQGYILSSDHNLHATGTKDNGSFEFNELAINGSYQVKDSIVFSGQIGSRDLGDEGNNSIYIDYLQADIQATDWFGIRIGRYKVPLGFYNQTRDIDLARPTVFLPQSIYPEQYRPFVENATGGLVYGNIHNDTIGYFDYELFYGKAGEDDESCLVQSMEIMLDGSNMSMDSGDIYGSSLQYTPNVDGLRFGFTISAGKSDFTYTDNNTNSPASQDGIMESISVLSMEYALGNFTFISEYMYSRQTNTLKVSSTTIFKDKLTEPEGFHIGGSYRINDQLETALYWENYYGDKNDKHGETKEAAGLPDHQAWQRAWTLAVRYDITSWWLVKAEGSLIDGTALTSPHYNEPAAPERYWNSVALKTTFHF